MSRGQSRARTRTRGKAPVILVFAENLNDAESIRSLLAHAEPSLARRLEPRPKPVSLTRTAKEPAVRRWIDELSGVVAATERGGTLVQAVVVHRDADGPDATASRHQQLAQQLTALGCAGHPVVPVQMTEAWWFLFPDAVEAVRPRVWRGTVPKTNRDVETIHDPKSELRRLTRRGGHGYSEADSPAIAKKIRELSPKQYGRSSSYSRLIATAAALTA